MKIKVEYFAHLKELASKSEESLEMPAGGLAELYENLKEKYGFPMPKAEIRPAVNDAFVSWGFDVKEGDRIVFIPPVTGG